MLQFKLSCARTRFLTWEPFFLHIQVANPLPRIVEILGDNILDPIHDVLQVEARHEGIAYQCYLLDSACRRRWADVQARQNSNARFEDVYHDRPGATMRLYPYEVKHYWVFSYQVYSRAESGPALSFTPGTHVLRLLFRGRPVSNSIEISIVRPSDTKLEEALSLLEGNQLRDPWLEPRARTYRAVQEVLALVKDPQVRRSFRFYELILGGDRGPEHRTAMMRELGEMLDDERLPVRHLVFQALRMATPDAESGPLAERYLRIWPSTSKPRSKERR